MDCELACQVLSAALDDEATASEVRAARRHLEACEGCRATMESLHRANRALRVQEVNISDLTSPILEEWDRAHVGGARCRFVRIGLALVGTINILLTAWFLSDARPSFLEPVGEHAGRELGAFSAMLAAAYLLSALDGRARARLGPVSIGIGILVVTAFTDLISSQTHVLYEVANHLPNVVGFALLWSLARSEPSMGAPRPTMRHERDEGMEEAA